MAIISTKSLQGEGQDFSTCPSPQPHSWQSLIGREKSRQHTILPRDIRRFLAAIGERSDCFETEIGSKRTHPVSSLFYQTLIFEDVDLYDLPPDGSPIELVIPDTGSRAVGGSSEFLINRPVNPGETLTIRTRIQNIYSKMGASGLLYFIVVETKFVDASQCLVAQELATYIRRD